MVGTLVLVGASCGESAKESETKEEIFNNHMMEVFEKFEKAIPELSDRGIECFEGRCTVVDFYFETIPDDLESIIWLQAIRLSKTKLEYTGRSVVTVNATFNGGINIGMENIELISGMDVKQWCEREIPSIKKSGPPDFKLIVSIMAGPNPDEWGELANMVEAAGADMIEMNVSCPHGMPERRMGALIGQDAELTASVIRGCKKGTSLPVMLKAAEAGHYMIEHVFTGVSEGRMS